MIHRYLGGESPRVPPNLLDHVLDLFARVQQDQHRFDQSVDGIDEAGSVLEFELSAAEFWASS